MISRLLRDLKAVTHGHDGASEGRMTRSEVMTAQLRAVTLWAVPCLILAAAFWLVASPIIWSPYWGDDMGNSQLPMQFAINNTQLWPWFLENNRGWMEGAGRFFPLSIAQGITAFVVFTDRESYKVYEFAMVAITFSLAAVVVGVFLRSRWCGFAAFGFALAALQFKSWYDPYWQFGGQQELVASLSLISILFAILAARAKRRWSFIALTILGAMALLGAALTYESSVFLVGVTFALLLRERRARSRRWVVGAVYAAVTFAVLANLYTLRQHATVTNPAYVISLVPHKVRETLVNQIISAIPGSYGHFTRGSVLPANASLPMDTVPAVAIAIAFLALMAFSLQNIMRLRIPDLSWGFVAGGVLWVIPSLFVAISSRWQAEVKPGLGYIPVIFGALAFSWIAVLVVAAIGKALQEYGPARDTLYQRTRWMVSGLLAVVMVGFVLATASSNEAAVRFEPFVALQSQRDGFIRSIESGLFAKPVAPDAVIIRSVPDWWFWQNAPFAAWYGAPSTLRFATPEEASTLNCGSASECYTLIERSEPDGSYSYSLAPVGA